MGTITGVGGRHNNNNNNDATRIRRGFFRGGFLDEFENAGQISLGYYYRSFAIPHNLPKIVEGYLPRDLESSGLECTRRSHIFCCQGCDERMVERKCGGGTLDYYGGG